MAKVKRRIRMVEVDMICDKCGDGYMRPDGVVYPTDPPTYSHVCDNCGATAEYHVQYPHIGYTYRDTGEEVKVRDT